MFCHGPLYFLLVHHKASAAFLLENGGGGGGEHCCVKLHVSQAVDANKNIYIVMQVKRCLCEHLWS